MTDTAAEDDATLLPSLEFLFESSIDTICPFGDIVLVAKDEFLPTAKFKVSSCILAMSSKVFEALFSKNFAEGQSMCSRSPGELLEIQTTDPPLAMKHLLRLLHHADPLEPGERIITTSAVLDLAIIADKYDCIEALRLPVDALLSKYLGNEDFTLDHLVTAAYMLDQPHHFRHFTRELVSTKIMVQANHFDKRCLELLPSALLSSLFCQQSMARQEVTKQITEFIEKFSAACVVASREVLVMKLFQELKEQDLWPITFGAFNIRNLCDKIQAISIPIISADDKTQTPVPRSPSLARSVTTRDIYGGWGTPTPKSRGWGSEKSPERYSTQYIDAPVHHDLKRMADSVRLLIVGVCFDCIQGNECRKRHRYYWSDTLSLTERYKAYEDSEDGSVYSRREIAQADQYEVFQWYTKHPGYWEDAW